MNDVDELDLLRGPGEKALWRDRSATTWRWALFLIALLLLGLVGNSLLNDVGWVSSAYIFVAGVAIIALVGGGGAEPNTLVTDARILRLGALRRFRSRRDPPYVVVLAEIDRVSLRDEGLATVVEVRYADTGKVDVLRVNQPQALATAIANAAGIEAPSAIGRLDLVAKVCGLIGAVIACLSWPQIEAMSDGVLSLGPADGHAASLLVEFVSFVPTFLGVMVVFITAQVPFAAAAMLIMPLYASAEEAGHWFSLRPSRWLHRWTGWKSRPYRWLAGLAYGGGLKVRG